MPYQYFLPVETGTDWTMIAAIASALAAFGATLCAWFSYSHAKVVEKSSDRLRRMDKLYRLLDILAEDQRGIHSMLQSKRKGEPSRINSALLNRNWTEFLIYWPLVCRELFAHSECTDVRTDIMSYLSGNPSIQIDNLQKQYKQHANKLGRLLLSEITEINYTANLGFLDRIKLSILKRLPDSSFNRMKRQIEYGIEE